MSEDDFLAYEDLFSTFDNPIPAYPVPTGHHLVPASDKFFNTDAQHPDKNRQIDMNISFDEKYPNMKSNYELHRVKQTMVLPVKTTRLTQAIIDHSHEIAYKILQSEEVDDIDRFINTLNTDPEYCLNHPPFRFRYVSVIVVSIIDHPSSDHIFC